MKLQNIWCPQVKKKENKTFSKSKQKKRKLIQTQKQDLNKLSGQNFWSFDNPTSYGTVFFYLESGGINGGIKKKKAFRINSLLFRPYFVGGEMFFGFFLVKHLFFSLGKMGEVNLTLSSSSLFFQKNVLKKQGWGRVYCGYTHD